ncbi:hypothetical protein GTP23_06855 [Pseudoduganella sp. FT93W]|uniref:DUF6644 domain-containing protein n=1 Tax=Duganella fentianensis TaxID=2692177 RepID=A0A845HVC6_9BURK|nr:DUF6644 family protein [Duganella fentianensis]MYN44792.1 hypothetical protein [Duganella fentianensis]
MPLGEFFNEVAALPVSLIIGESLDLFSALDVIHIVGVLLLAGSISVVDLRLLGVVFSDVGLDVLQRQILPLTIAGALLVFPTGIGLFLPQAGKIWLNPLLQAKLALLLLAAANIGYWHYNFSRHAEWSSSATLPWQARFAGASSLILWAGTLIAGRLIAFYI